MGCVSSNLLSHEDEFTQLGSSALSHHIVSLTSSTYGLLSLDPPPLRSAAPTTPPTPHLRFSAAGPEKTPLPNPLPDSKPIRLTPEVINSWELMAGLDAESFRFFSAEKQNPNPNPNPRVSARKTLSERFEETNQDEKVIVYTTSLRGVRKTFEDCTAVMSAIGGFGVSIFEKDVSMDRGFREELRGLMKGKMGNERENASVALPQVFVRGKHVGGAEEVLKFAEEGLLNEIFQGLPKKKKGNSVCEGCGDVRFLPCFECNGSCKVVVSKNVVVRCSECNENGLVLCPICS